MPIREWMAQLNVGFELRVPWGFRDARARACIRPLELFNSKNCVIRNSPNKSTHSTQCSAQFKREHKVKVTQTAIALNEEYFEQERPPCNLSLTAYGKSWRRSEI